MGKAKETLKKKIAAPALVSWNMQRRTKTKAQDAMQNECSLPHYNHISQNLRIRFISKNNSWFLSHNMSKYVAGKMKYQQN